MPSLTADEVVMQKHARAFIQYGAARPNNVVRFAGQDAQHFAVSGVTSPESGAIEPIYVHDPRRVGQYKLIGRTQRPADLSRSRLLFTEKHGALPLQLKKNGCALTVYLNIGVCKDLSDFTGGWSDYVMILSDGLVSEKDLGDRVTFGTDGPFQDSLGVTWADIYPVGALSFGSEAGVNVAREVVDVVYGSSVQCGDCGPADDGTGRIFALVKTSGAGSPGLPAKVTYSTDGGATWSDKQIDGIGATEAVTAIDVIGDKLVVLGEDAYFWALINTTTGVPGSFSKVSTGFVAAGSPQDMFALNPREIFFVGDGGYIYKSTDLTTGVTVVDAGNATAQDLKRIGGAEDTLVAVGATDTAIKSTNRGSTWATTTTAPGSGGTLQAVAVLDKFRFWVGSSTGKMYYTLNGGETWIQQTFTGSGAGQVRDIVFVNNEVGFMSHDSATPTAFLWATWNGGASWTRSDSGGNRMLNWPVFNRANRIAYPPVDNFVAANNVAVAGLAGDGLDGILLLGVASAT